MTTDLSKQERTYDILRERIVAGTYGPGHRLVIGTLAREFEISPMPVREAIRRLEAEGWVVYRRNQGAEVSPVDPKAWPEAMGTLAVLDGYATGLAAPLLEARDLARLREINDEMGAALAAVDVMRVSEGNRTFHQTIYDRCPNEHVRRQLMSIQERLDTHRGAIFLYVPARLPVSLSEHATLIDLVETGADPLEIELFARQHKLNTVAAYAARDAG
jgi:DNA-binding GntR family transcriptional regulator